MAEVQVVRPSSDQRESGRLQVLDTIRSAGRIARIDIAQATGFSPATVTAITSELLAAGLIEESSSDDQPSETRRGRPRVTLKLRGKAHRIAGLKVAQRTITMLIVDFEGKTIVDHEMEFPTARVSPTELVDRILKIVDATCRKGGFDRTGLSGLGIGLPGQINSVSNFVHWSSSLLERNVELGALLAQRLPFPVFVDNDANLVAKAEHLFGKGRESRNFLVVTLEFGVGLGIMIDGEVYRGQRGCGAEFGHTKVQLHGALCQCGQRGCLEAYVGDYALLREANGVTVGEPYTDVAQLVAAARGGDQVAMSIFERAGAMFGMGLANLINIFDPDLIILAGRSHNKRHIFLDAAVTRAMQSVVQVDAPPPEIRTHGWGDLMWAKGAAAYAIEKVSGLTVKDVTRNAS
ncbi:ROK family transcriptional regulator [Pseudoprimorskyibacter insulae]|nr:ROK family transcriptional regulator [Pseudoprimorskyibacter insulae]